MAVASTALLIPLLLVEFAPGVNASPDSQPTSYVTEVGNSTTAGGTSTAARAVGTVSGDDLAASRVFATFSRGDELRAQAEAEEAEAQAQAEAEAEAAAAAEAEEAERQQAAEERAAEERARIAELERIESERRAEEAATRAAQESASAPSIGMPAGTTAAQWNSLRMCESSNNYGAVNPAGPYLGAYQFLQSTWDGTARAAGRSDLVGVRPNQASPADQDAMAYALYNRSGSGPWPNCGRYLP